MLGRQKVALVTGITGQDGSYLVGACSPAKMLPVTELLMSKNYIVHGIKRRASSHNQQRIDAIMKQYPDRIFIHYGDLIDASAIAHLMREVKPDEVYNLAAQSHVAVSFVMPSYTSEVNASGTVNVLEAIRLAGLERTTRFYQASTSELYGGQTAEPFDEEVPFNPRSPYAAAKLMGYWVTRNYRDAYGMFACNGILFNHESPRRGETFVTRKITLAVAAIVTGQQEELVLGNINSVRDWGHARDYVECMWRMLQVETPDDFVIATGDTHTVRDFCDEAFGVVGINLQWEGSAESEVGWNKATGKVVVRVSPEFYRPTEVDHLLGNPRKAIEKLGFNPRKTSFKELVYEMVTTDLASAKAAMAAQKEFQALTARL